MPVLGSVLFDFGGTLDADGIRWGARFQRHYQERGGALDPVGFERVFREADRLLARRVGIAAMGFSAMVRVQSEILAGLVPLEGNRSWPAIAERFIGDAIRLAVRNRAILRRLAQRHRLGVVSNFSGNLLPCLEELGLREFFEVVIDSAVFGAQKPDPQPFLAALAALGTSVPASWMVGDNPEADIRPALQLGLRACWVTEPARKAPSGLVPSARIASLVDLEETLDRACTA